MGALLGTAGRWALGGLIGSIAIRNVSDGVKDVTDSAGNSAQKAAPVIVAVAGATAFAGAAIILYKNK